MVVFEMGIKKLPFAYVHPNKNPANQDLLSDPISVSPATISVIRKTKVTPRFETAERVSVRLVVHFPKLGVSAEYDAMLKDKISSKRATLALLKRGLDQFEEQNLKSTSYSCETNYVETIRSIERSTYDLFKQKHDPHEIMSARALGKKLGTAILANYFARMKSEETK